MLKNTLIILILIWVMPVFASKELFSKYKYAVVKITIKIDGKDLSHGSGFFIENEGYIVTNAHVLNLGPKGEIEIKKFDGSLIKDFKLSDCDRKKIDLCLIKTNIKPKSYFTLNQQKFERGEETFVIGHSLGLDYSFSDGIISGVRKFNQIDPKSTSGTELYQTTSPISPGNSGGPIFSNKGVLIGVATFVMNSSKAQNLNFCISNKELLTFFKQKKKEAFMTLNDMRKKNLIDLRTSINKYIKTLKDLHDNHKNYNVDLKKKYRPLALSKIDSQYGVTFYLNKDLFKCQYTKNALTCLSELNSLHVLSIESDKTVDDGFSKIGKIEGRKKKNIIFPKDCKRQKQIFNNFKKPLEVCHSSEIISSGGAVHYQSIKIGKNSNLSVFSMFKSNYSQEFVKTFSSVLIGFSNITKVKHTDSQKVKSKKIANSIVKNIKVSGVVQEIYVSSERNIVRLGLSDESGIETSLSLDVDFNNFDLPQIVKGDQLAFFLEGKQSDVQYAKKFHRFSGFKYKVKNTSQTSRDTSYEIHRLSVSDSRIYMTAISRLSRQKVKVYFYGAAMKKLIKLKANKFDIITLGSADIIDTNKVIYIRSNKIRSFKKIADKNGLKSYIHQGVVENIRYHNNGKEQKERLELKLKSNGKSVHFTLRFNQADKKLLSTSLIAPGMKVKIKLNIKMRRLNRYLKKQDFTLYPEDFHIEFLSSKQVDNIVLGTFNRIYLYDHYAYLRIKKDGKAMKFYVYDKSALKFLSQMKNLKKGDEVKIGSYNIVDSRGDFHILHNFQMEILQNK